MCHDFLAINETKLNSVIHFLRTKITSNNKFCQATQCALKISYNDFRIVDKPFSLFLIKFTFYFRKYQAWKITFSLNTFPACTFIMYFWCCFKTNHKYKRSLDTKHALYFLMYNICRQFLSVWVAFFKWCHHTRLFISFVAWLFNYKLHFWAVLFIFFT